MRDNKDVDGKEIDTMRARFKETVRIVSHLLGPAAFRITDTTGRRIDPAVNRALFDAHMLTGTWITTDLKDIDIGTTRRELAQLFGNEDFLDAIQLATGDRSRTLRRIRETTAALRRANVDLQVPFDLSR